MNDFPWRRAADQPPHRTDKPWHRYVFDPEARAFVGDFEGLYRAEAEGHWDAWNQSDPRRLDTRIAALLIEQITFASALDIGCGTGSSTAALKRRDNHVVGLDVSATAIATAQARFPDVDWVVGCASDYLADAEQVDLIVIREFLSLVEDWRETLARCAEIARYCLLSLFLPADPISVIKTHAELEEEAERHFTELETVRLSTRSLNVYLLESRSAPSSPNP